MAKYTPFNPNCINYTNTSPNMQTYYSSDYPTEFMHERYQGFPTSGSTSFSRIYSPKEEINKPSKLNFKSLGIPSTKDEADIQFTYYKCKIAAPILKTNWKILLSKCNFFTMIDKEKVSFSVSSKELNSILNSGFFTENEQKKIKKIRYQGRNNLAAKTMREKYKDKDRNEENELSEIYVIRDELILEKERLRNEIDQYKFALSQLGKFTI